MITFRQVILYFCSLDFYLLSLQQATFPLAFGGSGREQSVCREEMPSVTGGKHQPSPGLLGAALQPATLEVVVGISSSSSLSLSSLSSSVAGNRSAAAVLGTGELPFPSLGCLEQQGGRSNPIPLLPAAAPVLWSVFASHLDFQEQQNSVLVVLLRNPRVTLCVPSHKLLRQNVQGRKRTCFYFCFLLKKLAGN